MKRLIALLVAGVLMFAMSMPAFGATESDSVLATVKVNFVAVQVEDGVVAYGTLDVNTSKSTVQLSNTQVISVTDSNVPVTIKIQSSDATGPGTPWNLETTTGADQYTHEYALDGSTWVDFPDTNDLTVTIATLTGTGTQNLDLRITTPTSVSDGAEKTITITVQGEG